MRQTRRIRILLLVDTLATGGAEQVVVDTACGLNSDRFAPHVVVTRGSGSLQRQLEKAGLPVTILHRRTRLSARAYRRVTSLAGSCDIIHAHKFGSNVWGALVARRVGLPLIVHEHNWSESSSPFQSLCNRRWIAPSARRIFCVSSSVAAAMIADGVPPERIEVLPNAVPPDAAFSKAEARRQLGLPAAGFVVGIVGQLRPEKNHELLLLALGSLQLVHRETTLCVIGSGPRLGFLRQEAVRLGVAANVVWTGWREEARRLASAFDVAVICSNWEGLPLAGLEAMAAGVPVVATAVGGLPDLLAGDAGVLVPPGDAHQLAAAITQLQADPVHAHRVGRTGQGRVRRDHDLRQMIGRLEATYADVVADSRTSRTQSRSSTVRS
jgi:glycosyltransferase involved in cell wall biosynthesis